MIQHPFQHGPGHFGKAGHEMVMPEAEARHAVDRIRNQFGSDRKIGHEHAFGIGAFAVLRLDLGYCTNMTFNRYPGSGSRTLAGMVVRCRAYAAEAEHDVATCHCGPERSRDACRIVAQVLAPGETQASCRQDIDDLDEMLVLPLAGDDFITDDEGTNPRHIHG